FGVGAFLGGLITFVGGLLLRGLAGVLLRRVVVIAVVAACSERSSKGQHCNARGQDPLDPHELFPSYATGSIASPCRPPVGDLRLHRLRLQRTTNVVNPSILRTTRRDPAR